MTELEAKAEAIRRWGDKAAIRMTAQPSRYTTGRLYWDWKYQVGFMTLFGYWFSYAAEGESWQQAFDKLDKTLKGT